MAGKIEEKKVKKILTPEEKIARETVKLLKQKQEQKKYFHNKLSSILRCDLEPNDERFISLTIVDNEIDNIDTECGIHKDNFKSNTKVYYLLNNKFRIVRSFEEAKKLNIDIIKQFMQQNNFDRALIVLNRNEYIQAIVKSIAYDLSDYIQTKYRSYDKKVYVARNKKLQIVTNQFILKMPRNKYEKFIIALNKPISQLSVNEIELLKEYKKWPFNESEKHNSLSDLQGNFPSGFRMMPPCMGCR